MGNMEFSFLVNSPDDRDYFYVEQPDERIGIKVLVGTYDGDVVYTDQIEHTARRYSAWLPPIQCTLSGHQCMMLIQV